MVDNHVCLLTCRRCDPACNVTNIQYKNMCVNIYIYITHQSYEQHRGRKAHSKIAFAYELEETNKLEQTCAWRGGKLSRSNKNYEYATCIARDLHPCHLVITPNRSGRSQTGIHVNTSQTLLGGTHCTHDNHYGVLVRDTLVMSASNVGGMCKKLIHK